MKKAYDRLDCRFLIKVMEKMGFDSLVIDKVRNWWLVTVMQSLLIGKLIILLFFLEDEVKGSTLPGYIHLGFRRVI